MCLTSLRSHFGMVRVWECVENFEDGASRSAGCSRTPWGLVVVLVVGSAAAGRVTRMVVVCVKMCVLRCMLLLECVWMICRVLRALQRRFDRYLNRPRWKVTVIFVLGVLSVGLPASRVDAFSRCSTLCPAR